MSFPLSTVMLVRLLQPENALTPIVVTELGMLMLVRLLQSLNALIPIVVTELGMSMLVRPVQYLNAPLPIVVTELGITVLLHPAMSVFVEVSIMALHPPRESYVLFPLSTVMLVRLLQSENALIPIVVTELGMLMLVRPRH